MTTLESNPSMESSSSTIIPNTSTQDSEDCITASHPSSAQPLPPPLKHRYFPSPPREVDGATSLPRTTTNGLRDREQKLIADLLIKFKDIVDFTRDQDGVEQSSNGRLTTATQAYVVEVKTAELIKAAEDLLTLTRQLKEMWAFGKLRGVGEGEEEGELEEDAKKVGTMIDKIMSKNNHDDV